MSISNLVHNPVDSFHYKHGPVADSEICPMGGGGDDSRNLRRIAAAICFLTSFNRDGGPGPPPPGSVTVVNWMQGIVEMSLRKFSVVKRDEQIANFWIIEVL